MPIKVIHVELLVSECSAELFLNDIPVDRLTPQRPHLSYPAHLQLVDGENRLELVIEPGPTPGESRKPGAGPATATGDAVGKICAYVPGQFTNEANAEVLGRVEWRAGAPAPFPQTVAASVNLGRRFGRWNWESAAPLTLDAATVDSVAGILRQIRTTLSAGDPSYLASLGQAKFENAARAYPGETAAQIEQQFRDFILQQASRGRLDFQPLSPADFDFRLVAGRRIVECINKDWRPALRTIPPANATIPGYFPMFLSYFNGRWNAVI
jgi:hypothetical protein